MFSLTSGQGGRKMGRSRRGSGSVFQRMYRDTKGKNRKTANWYIEFVAGNRTIREATDFTNRTDAAEFLKKRMRSELLTRQWRHVDFGGKGWLRIDAGEAKDATAGREFQFTTWMREALERQRKFISKVEKKTKSVIPWVFCRPDGVRIHTFYEPWALQQTQRLAGPKVVAIRGKRSGRST